MISSVKMNLNFQNIANHQQESHRCNVLRIKIIKLRLNARPLLNKKLLNLWGKTRIDQT